MRSGYLIFYFILSGTGKWRSTELEIQGIPYQGRREEGGERERGGVLVVLTQTQTEGLCRATVKRT